MLNLFLLYGELLSLMDHVTVHCCRGCLRIGMRIGMMRPRRGFCVSCIFLLINFPLLAASFDQEVINAAP